MREILYVATIPLTSFIGLAAFTTWWSALIFLGGLGLFIFLAVGRQEEHARSEAYDDHLTDERMDRARKWLVEQ